MGTFPAPLAERRALLEQIECLKEEVRRLDTALRGSAQQRSLMMTLFGVTATEAKLLGVLVKRPHPRKEDLFESAWGHHTSPPDEKIVDTLICKMRPKLRPFGIEIRNIWGIGYEMTLEHRERLKNILRDAEPQNQEAQELGSDD